MASEWVNLLYTQAAAFITTERRKQTLIKVAVVCSQSVLSSPPICSLSHQSNTMYAWWDFTELKKAASKIVNHSKSYTQSHLVMISLLDDCHVQPICQTNIKYLNSTHKLKMNSSTFPIPTNSFSVEKIWWWKYTDRFVFNYESQSYLNPNSLSGWW